MVGDNAELTFVRCPSCRSLVPAISTKCRMCGATFDASQEIEEKPRTASGRVRQQTTSVSSAREEIPPTAPAARQTPDVDDPLRGYVEEITVDPIESINAANGNSEARLDPPMMPPGAERGVPPHRAEPQRSSSAAMAAAAETPAPPRGDRTSAPGPLHQSPAPKVMVESGKGRPGGLSFGKREGVERRVEATERTPNRPAPAAQSPRPKGEDERMQAHNKSPSEQRMERAAQARAAQAQDRSPTGGRSERTAQRPQTIPQNTGTLVGWLVDFSDGKGQGIELREGQFFITRQKLKDSDLVLEDDSISTPHALVRVTPQTGLEIQDLMSDRGIHLQRREGDGFKPQEERTRVNHGDRVRIGNLEYVVALVPQKGTKS